MCGEGGKREKLYEQVAALGDKWNKQYGNVGLVVGATAPAEMAEIRSVAPTPWILAPGVGFQVQPRTMSECADASGLRWEFSECEERK